jgi:uncharacterized membrane protein YjjP (DUF1212 family)
MILESLKKEEMKYEIDILTIVVGFVSAFIKAINRGLTWLTVLISATVGALFSWGICGTIIYFLPKISGNVHILIVLAFMVGRLTDEVLKKLDQSVEDFYKLMFQYLKQKFKIK